jgi:hypothetical protein
MIIKLGSLATRLGSPHASLNTEDEIYGENSLCLPDKISLAKRAMRSRKSPGAFINHHGKQYYIASGSRGTPSPLTKPELF